MKEYIKQFYSEGLANIFYVKPLNYLKKRLPNDMNPVSWTQGARFLYDKINL